ncbi:MAG: ankyrin repeat domain-containing protein [Nitrosopumilus sp.]
MKAKFVYEAMGDVLKPKSEEEILASIGDLSPDKLLSQSAEKGFLAGVNKALEDGADVHAVDDFALRFASYKGYYDVVKLLLDRGADVHANIHAQDDALHWASQNGHYDVVELLKKYM